MGSGSLRRTKLRKKRRDAKFLDGMLETDLAGLAYMYVGDKRKCVGFPREAFGRPDLLEYSRGEIDI